jgi:signal transduction histidine kinase
VSSLRFRLAVLLIAAIVSVVALASLVAISVIGLPDRDRFFDAAAGQILAFVAEMQSEPAAASKTGSGRLFAVSPQPLDNVDPELTEALRGAMERTGSSLRPQVSRIPADRGFLVSVPLEDHGWAVIPMMEPGAPPAGWLALITWMAVIIVGTTTVALVVAYKMTQPLHVLERAVGSVGADGVLPPVPETGSAEVRATAAALNALSARLKSAVEGRMRLVAAAGHDLRTPMTRMRLRAEFVSDEEERSAWLKDLDDLGRIADSAIDLVREEVRESAREVLPLHSLVREVVAELAELGLAVETGELEPVFVRAAPWGLKRALRNLMANAATHGGGAAVKLVRYAGKAVVDITDRGPGIPPDLLDRVFEPFFQVDPARRKRFGGAGLGLAIAREIIERQGGTIALVNRAEGGLLQRVSLPEHGAEAAPS